MASSIESQREQCVVYASRATELFSPVDLETLAARAAVKNRALGLSGVLIYSAGHFVQAIEGPHERLQSLLARIAEDPRHRDLRVLAQGAIRVRSFSEWHMGVLRREGRDHLDLERLETVAAMFNQCRGPADLHQRARALLREFRRMLPAPAA